MEDVPELVAEDEPFGPKREVDRDAVLLGGSRECRMGWAPSDRRCPVELDGDPSGYVLLASWRVLSPSPDEERRESANEAVYEVPVTKAEPNEFGAVRGAGHVGRPAGFGIHLQLGGALDD